MNGTIVAVHGALGPSIFKDLSTLGQGTTAVHTHSPKVIGFQWCLPADDGGNAIPGSTLRYNALWVVTMKSQRLVSMTLKQHVKVSPLVMQRHVMPCSVTESLNRWRPVQILEWHGFAGVQTSTIFEVHSSSIHQLLSFRYKLPMYLAKRNFDQQGCQGEVC